MAEIEIPGIFVNIVLQPLAKILKVKYIPKGNNKLLMKKIFEKFADRAQKLDTGTFQKIITHLEKIIQPASSIGVMIATLLKPLVAIIPPQYLIIIVAGVMLTFLMFFFVYPAMFIGLFTAYHLESAIKLPFNNMSKRKVNAIYPLTWRDQFIVKKVEKKTFSAPLIHFLALPLETQYDYLYENDIPKVYNIVLRVLRHLPENLRTVESLQAIIENPEKYGINPMVVDSIIAALTTPMHLTATFYSGMRRVFPPILHRVVNIVKRFLLNVSDPEYVEKVGKQIAESPATGMTGVAFNALTGLASKTNPEKWKPDPNV